MKKSFLNSLIVLLVIFIAACGRKGNVRPPEDSAPDVVQYLSATASLDGVQLIWVEPERDVAGSKLRDLSAFTVKRSNFVAESAPSYSEIGEVNVALGEKPQDQANGLASGLRRFRFEDKKVEVGKRYEYVIVAVNENDVEGPADQAVRVTFRGESSTFENVNVSQQ